MTKGRPVGAPFCLGGAVVSTAARGSAWLASHNAARIVQPDL
jgi:hypothetical protein